jgi:hypothetical protein
MRRRLIGRNQAPDVSPAPPPGTTAGMPDLSQVSRRLGALVTRLGSSRRKPRSRAPARVRQPPKRPALDLTEEWIRLGAHVERIAPADVSLEVLCRVEDAAAERIYQRSRRGQFTR